MRIVHLLPALVKGGGERAAVDLANWQAGQGHRVTIVAGWKVADELLRCDVDAAIEVRYIGSSSAYRYAHASRWVWRNRRWLAQQEIVHAHLTYGAVIASELYVLRRVARRPRPAIVETYHAVGMPIAKSQRWVHRQMAKMRDATVLMAENRYWRPFLAGRPYPRSTVILNGLAPPRCLVREDPSVESYRLAAGLTEEGQLVIGSVGRLVAERRPDLIVQLFGRLAARYSAKIDFLLVGAGPEESHLKALATDLGIDDRIHFPGLAIDPALPLALMDLYVTVNIGAVTGLAGVHAASCAVPVVAIQLDAQHRAGESDWIWSDTDVEAVASHILQLLEDDLARRQLAQRQQEFARDRLSITRMGAAYEELYRSLLR